MRVTSSCLCTTRVCPVGPEVNPQKGEKGKMMGKVTVTPEEQTLLEAAEAQPSHAPYVEQDEEDTDE